MSNIRKVAQNRLRQVPVTNGNFHERGTNSMFNNNTRDIESESYGSSNRMNQSNSNQNNNSNTNSNRSRNALGVNATNITGLGSNKSNRNLNQNNLNSQNSRKSAPIGSPSYRKNNGKNNGINNINASINASINANRNPPANAAVYLRPPISRGGLGFVDRVIDNDLNFNLNYGFDGNNNGNSGLDRIQRQNRSVGASDRRFGRPGQCGNVPIIFDGYGVLSFGCFFVLIPPNSDYATYRYDPSSGIYSPVNPSNYDSFIDSDSDIQTFQFIDPFVNDFYEGPALIPTNPSLGFSTSVPDVAYDNDGNVYVYSYTNVQNNFGGSFVVYGFISPELIYAEGRPLRPNRPLRPRPGQDFERERCAINGCCPCDLFAPPVVFDGYRYYSPSEGFPYYLLFPIATAGIVTRPIALAPGAMAIPTPTAPILYIFNYSGEIGVYQPVIDLGEGYYQILEPTQNEPIFYYFASLPGYGIPALVPDDPLYEYNYFILPIADYYYDYIEGFGYGYLLIQAGVNSDPFIDLDKLLVFDFVPNTYYYMYQDTMTPGLSFNYSYYYYAYDVYGPSFYSCDPYKYPFRLRVPDFLNDLEQLSFVRDKTIPLIPGVGYLLPQIEFDLMVSFSAKLKINAITLNNLYYTNNNGSGGIPAVAQLVYLQVDPFGIVLSTNPLLTVAFTQGDLRTIAGTEMPELIENYYYETEDLNILPTANLQRVVCPRGRGILTVRCDTRFSFTRAYIKVIDIVGNNSNGVPSFS